MSRPAGIKEYRDRKPPNYYLQDNGCVYFGQCLECSLVKCIEDMTEKERRTFRRLYERT